MKLWPRRSVSLFPFPLPPRLVYLPLFAERIDAPAREETRLLRGMVDILVDPMVEEWDPYGFDHDPFRAWVADVAMRVARIASDLLAFGATNNSWGRIHRELNQLRRICRVNDGHTSKCRKHQSRKQKRSKRSLSCH